MIEYLLIIHICSNLTAQCTWAVEDIFPSEAWCVGQGLSLMVFTHRNAEFRCVRTKGIENDTMPETLEDWPPPLPKPRPRTVEKAR